MTTKFFLHLYKVRGRGLSSEQPVQCRTREHALLRAEMLSSSRAGIVVAEQATGDDADEVEPIVHAIHGRVPPDWDDARRAA